MRRRKKIRNMGIPVYYLLSKKDYKRQRETTTVSYIIRTVLVGLLVRHGLPRQQIKELL